MFDANLKHHKDCLTANDGVGHGDKRCVCPIERIEDKKQVIMELLQSNMTAMELNSFGLHETIAFLNGQKYLYEIDQPLRNRTFCIILAELLELHEKKSYDYAQQDNVYSNFEKAAEFSGVDVETCFRIWLGTKMARIIELTSGKTAKNESLDDTIRDNAIYSILWLCWRRIHLNKDGGFR